MFRDKLIKIRNKKLCKKYPFLLPVNVWTGKVSDDYDYSYTLNDCLVGSWQKFSPKIWKELKAILIEGNYLHDFYFEQIKEKYGTLRLYYGSIPTKISDKMYAWENKYKKLSEQVCIYCGKPATHYTSGWISYVCKKCASKHKIKNELVELSKERDYE